MMMKSLLLQIAKIDLNYKLQLYPPVPNNSPPVINLLFFVASSPPPISYLDPPPSPRLIIFPDFVLEIFQRFLKLIILFAKLQAV